MRGATEAFNLAVYLDGVSIHAPHAGGDRDLLAQALAERVSIHAPHAGGDGLRSSGPCRRMVSIHAPHAGGDSTP